MADNYSQGVIWPPIPEDLLDRETKLRLIACGIAWEKTENGFYLFAEDGPYNGQLFSGDSQDSEEVDYIELLRELIVRSRGRLKALTLEGADACTKMRPDGFGGFAFIITPDPNETLYISSYQWVREKAEELGLTDAIYGPDPASNTNSTPIPTEAAGLTTTAANPGGGHVDDLG